ncbi:MAG: type II toxin-antitoxin system Phd/YefM family antitoxin [Verrucomicrobiae bacterium]|nr:type II toxin-antitoxin system Phd/YefM family antitoxin [Verrucomicrobiae bacterium]
MNGTAISVTEAARDFLTLMERVESRRESAVITREGRPVATFVPVDQTAQTSEELAERLAAIPRLPSEEAEAFARDIEECIQSLPPLKSPWD